MLAQAASLNPKNPKTLKLSLLRTTLCAVISIRGTLSMDDCLTDFMCEPAEMDSWLSTAQTAHSGKLGDRAGTKQGADPHGLVGSGEGHGFGPEGRRRRAARPGACSGTADTTGCHGDIGR